MAEQTGLLCKDCKWCEPNKAWIFSRNKWEFAHCGRTAHIVKAEPSPVDGKPRSADQRVVEYCSIERKHGDCGRNATMFEAKP